MIVIFTLPQAQLAYRMLMANEPLSREGRSGERAGEIVDAIEAFCEQNSLKLDALTANRTEDDIKKDFYIVAKRQYLHDAGYCWLSLLAFSEKLSTSEVRGYADRLARSIYNADIAAEKLGEEEVTLASIDPVVDHDPDNWQRQLNDRLIELYLRNAKEELAAMLTHQSDNLDAGWRAMRMSMDSAKDVLIKVLKNPLEHPEYKMLREVIAKRFNIPATLRLPSIPLVNRVSLLAKQAEAAGTRGSFVDNVKGEDEPTPYPPLR